MEIKVYLSEIQTYIKAHIGREFSISKVSDREFHAAVAQNIVFKTVWVGIDLGVLEVEKDAVTLSYNSNKGINL